MRNLAFLVVGMGLGLYIAHLKGKLKVAEAKLEQKVKAA